jgi:hypothetical protein
MRLSQKLKQLRKTKNVNCENSIYIEVISNVENELLV